MSKPTIPSGNIDFDRLWESARGVAKYAGRYTGYETFLGYHLKSLEPLLLEHAVTIPSDGMVKIIFEHWVLIDDRVHYSSEEPYHDLETVSYRLMSYVVSVEDLLEYEGSLNGYGNPGHPNGDFDLLDWSDVAVSDGEIPDDVVNELCNYLKNHCAIDLNEEFDEAFKNGELPKWDPRITKVVEEACIQSIDSEDNHDTMLADEPPWQKKQREEHFKVQSRIVSSCWITQEFNDTLDSIKFYKSLRDKTTDPAERKRFQDQVESLIGCGIVTEEDVALSERIDSE